MENKPFIFGAALSEQNFTNRDKETKRLTMNFENGVSTIIISPRRWGKTSLVRKVSAQVQSDRIKVVNMDIFACRSEKEFYDTYTSEILKQTSSKIDEIIDTAKKLITRVVPKFSFGVDPMTDFSVSLDWNEAEDNITEVLNLPEKIAQDKGISIVVCIDEFQQIAEFDNSKTFQKRLRTAWQHHKNASYCLYGSKQHLMNELFEKRSLPFYKFGDSIYLKKISTEHWVEYICAQFQRTKKNISADLATKICLTVDNHSYYVQQLSWLLWTYTENIATEADFTMAVQDIIDQNSLLFERQTENLSSYQMNFLRALIDGVEREFTTQDILNRYKLGTSANIVRLKKALQNKELIDIEGKIVHLSDPVMKLWLKQKLR